MIISASKYDSLDGSLAPNLSGGNPIFYGLSTTGERRCLEEETLYYHENEHNYKSGIIVMRDGTRMAVSSIKAKEAGWLDLMKMMEEKGL